MSFPWLELRISEEMDRRRREQAILERLPAATEELHATLSDCVAKYQEAFGEESAAIVTDGSRIEIEVHIADAGEWKPATNVSITANPLVPGFEVERGEFRMVIEIGLLPGDKLFYRDQQTEQYINLEEVTKRILDRAFFPKLRE